MTTPIARCSWRCRSGGRVDVDAHGGRHDAVGHAARILAFQRSDWHLWTETSFAAPVRSAVLLAAGISPDLC